MTVTIPDVNAATGQPADAADPVSTTEPVSTAELTDLAGQELRLRRELAAVYRLVALYGMSDLIFTHISVRLPGPEQHFLINPYGLLFEEITASSLVRIDLDGRPVGPAPHPVNPAGFVIHSAIHAGRQDAHCVLHTHTKAGCAVAAQADGLLPVNQMSLEFYGKVAYHDYEGIALNLDERHRLVADLADHPVMILRNHGLLTVGRFPAEAFLRMYYLHRACEIQIAAQTAGAALIIPTDDICRRTADQFAGTADDDLGGDPQLELDLVWSAFLRQLDRLDPHYID